MYGRRPYRRAERKNSEDNFCYSRSKSLRRRNPSHRGGKGKPAEENGLLRVSLLINNLAADDGHLHRNCENLLRLSLIEVIGIHNDVGQHSGSDSSLAFFFELRVSRAHGVGAKTFVRVQMLLRLPTALGSAVGQSAGDTGVNSTQRIDGNHGIVGAEGQAHAVSFHAAPSVSAAHAFGAKAVGGPTRVIQKLGGLHGGDHI